MSKTIKRIISSLLVVTAFATAGPIGFVNLLTQKAYASDSWSSSDHALLDSLDTDEGTFDFSRTKSSAKGKVKSSISKVKITAKAEDSSYKVTIEGSTESGECEEEVDLDKGSNTIKIKVEDPTGSKDSVTYYAHITRGTSSSSSDDDDDDDSGSDVYLRDLSISDHNFTFSGTTKNYNVEVNADVSQIEIKARPEDKDDDTVTIDGDTVDDNYRRTVSLDNGKNEIKVKVEDDNDNERTYTLNVYRGEKAPSENVGVGEVDNIQDSIYLDKLKLVDVDNSLNFNKKVTAYEVNVPDDCDRVMIKAEADDSGDNVRVNDDEVDSNNNRTVMLEKGKNIIKVKVYSDDDKNDDDYEERIYTITVNRGGTANKNNTNTAANTSNATGNSAANTTANSTVKANQWVKNSAGQWTYNDGLGKPLTNAWYYDKDYGKYYHFGFDGSMNTGWQYDNGKTYYLNDDGSMQIGWKYIGSFWRYFNNDGAMTMSGWVQTSDGKWYYFYPGGGMASNIKINGYTLGSDGAML